MVFKFINMISGSTKYVHSSIVMIVMLNVNFSSAKRATLNQFDWQLAQKLHNYQT